MNPNSCSENCLHFGFCDPLPGGGHGSNLWCRKHKKRIKNSKGKCSELEDRYEKVYINDNNKQKPASLPVWIVPVKCVVVSDHVGEWCRLQYPGHPKGCPNYGEKPICPPFAPPVREYFDLSKPLYLVHSDFDLTGHADRMKVAHPQWSERQCRCVLYWQPRSRKQMRERVKDAIEFLSLNAVAEVPEAMGVNVYATAQLSGLRLERIRYLKICRHISLVGFKLQ